MKNSHLKYIFLLTIIVFVSSADILGQKIFIPQERFSIALSKARDSVYEKKRSRETIISEYESGNVVVERTHVYQYLAKDNYRYYERTTTPEGVAEENESIRVGFFRYERKNGSDWTKIDLRGGFGTGSDSSVSGGSASLSQYAFELVFLESGPAELYEKIDVMKYGVGLRTIETRYWIGQDGSLLQEETVEASLSPRVIKSRRTVKYEYDPNIKIEAPIK